MIQKSQFGINADEAIIFLNTMPSRAAGTPEGLAGQPQIGDRKCRSGPGSWRASLSRPPVSCSYRPR